MSRQDTEGIRAPRAAGTREPVLEVGEDDPELVTALDRALTAYNMAATGVAAERAFSVRLGDESGLLGGLTGWTWGRCAGINMVWVREEQRGAGWGRRLLAAAEEEAARRGCNRIFVSSFTFQAPGFYARQGYRETARVEGLLAEDAADVWFVKRLRPAPGT